MDEPTSSLTLAETGRLLRVIADLKASGVSVIFISHRLDEVTDCADRVVVLRDGRLVGRLAKGEISPAAMIRLMIGRDLKSIYRPPAAPPGEPMLEVQGARTATYPTREVDLALRRGEILGLAGLIGAGRTELARALFGIDRLLAGSVRLDGRAVAIASPRERSRAASTWCRRTARLRPRARPLDRARTSRCRNLAASPRAAGGPRRGDEARRRRARRAARHPGAAIVRRTSARSPAATSRRSCWRSGWRCSRSVIIFDEPTRGIDVGAKREIYDLMRGARRRRRRDSDDLQRHGRGDRRQRPRRGDARGRNQRHPRAQPSSPSTGCSSWPWDTAGGTSGCRRRTIGLLVLILVVGAVVAIINPRFLSPINIANTANLVGLFGIFAIGQGFVIITGGIELSVGSVIALLGVIFVDLIANYGVPWPLGDRADARARRADRAVAWAPDHAARTCSLSS